MIVSKTLENTALASLFHYDCTPNSCPTGYLFKHLFANSADMCNGCLAFQHGQKVESTFSSDHTSSNGQVKIIRSLKQAESALNSSGAYVGLELSGASGALSYFQGLVVSLLPTVTHLHPSRRPLLVLLALLHKLSSSVKSIVLHMLWPLHMYTLVMKMFLIRCVLLIHIAVLAQLSNKPFLE